MANQDRTSPVGSSPPPDDIKLAPFEVLAIGALVTLTVGVVLLVMGPLINNVYHNLINAINAGK